MALSGATVSDREVRHDMEERDDLTLLENIAQRRDRASFAELLARYEKRAYSLALHLTHHHELAQDAVQEAMLDIWLQASTYRPGNATGWILRIVTNKSITLAKQRYKDGAQMLEPEAGHAAVRDPSPADLSEREEQLGVLRESLERLPLLDRQVLALCYAGGLSQAETGKALSLPRMAISRRLAKACAQVREQLAQAGYAAALPLVSAEGLCEALCSGHVAPPGLRERVLECTADAMGASLGTAASHSRRAAAAKTGSSALLSGTVAAFVAMAGLGALCFTPPRAQPVPDRSAPAVATGLMPTAPARISRVWDFNSNATPKDLTVVAGEWHQVDRAGCDGSGCMETDKGVRFILDVPIEQLPIAVSFQAYSSSGLDTSAMWERHEGETLFLTLDQTRRSFEAGTWSSWRRLVTSDAISLYPAFDSKMGTHPLCVSLVRRKDRARLQVGFEPLGPKEAVRIDNLRLESIPPEQAPELHSFVAALEKIPPSERTGKKMLEGGASPVPGEVFSVKFFPGSADLEVKP